MAKFGLKINLGDLNFYLHRWLKYQCELHHIPLSDDPDIWLVSLSDAHEFGTLYGLQADGRPIIAGGGEVANDHVYQHFVDLLVIGEGFEFFRDLEQIAHLPPDVVLSELEKKPYILSRAKEKAIPSTCVNWAEAPLIQVAPKKKMILWARGCQRKCKFCFTSWTTKYQTRPPMLVPLPEKVMLISNDNSTEWELSYKAYARSIYARDYLRMTEKQAKNCRYYRFGIESFTEKGRMFLGKPITNEEIRKLYLLGPILKHDYQFFIIAGFEPQESLLEFLDAMGEGDQLFSPKIIFKITWFNPCQHTPLKNFDIRELHVWDKDWIWGRLTSFSPRFRLCMGGDPGDAYFRTFFHRARTKEEAITIWKARNRPGSEIIQIPEKYGWGHMYNQAAPTKIDYTGFHAGQKTQAN